MLALVGLALTGGAAPAGATRDGRYAATIRRTAYGIPHVLARDYGSLGFGYGYAFAQDDLCVLADEVVTWRGRRSEYFGPDAPSTDALGASTTDLASDTYFQGLRRAGTVAALVARPAPLGPTAQVRALVDGYVAGYNRYLRGTGVANLPDRACRGKPWVGPITALDVWTGLVALNEQSGTAQYRQDIADAAPPAPGSTGTAAVPAEPADQPDIGSNGWALGRDATRAHDGMVLANPHVPWLGDARFYQVQLTIPGVLDVSGGSLYGTPLVEIGHTTGLAWTHTATHAQHASLYQLKLVPGDPTSYLVDGHPVPMTRQAVTVPVPGGAVTRTLWFSRYGPVLATGWTTGTAYSLRDANADNTRAANEWLAMDRAQSLSQLRAAQRTYQGLPWVYTLATDATGRVWFTDSSVVPDLIGAQRQRCLLQGDPERPDVLDGSTVDCDWGTDPAAVEPGLLDQRQAPTLDRTDYVADSNNGPLYANPNQPLTGYPAVYDGRTDLELRPRLGLTMIAQRIAGTDGLGAPGFTLDTLRDSMLGDRNLSGELGRADVLAMCQSRPTETASDGSTVDVRAACATLAGWDGRDGVDSGGAVLWGAFFDSLGRYGGPPGKGGGKGGGGPAEWWWTVPADPTDPVGTPRGIDTADPRVGQALADTVEQFGAAGLALDATPGDTMRWAGVPLHGCDEQQGCFDVVDATATSGTSATDPSPDNAAFGTGFVMAVELTPHGPRASELVTYSESADPGSPHHTDQTELFSRSRWVPERFTENEIRSDPALRTTTVDG